MSVIRADYVTADGVRIIYDGEGHGWERTVIAHGPWTYWAPDASGLVTFYRPETGSQFVRLEVTPEYLAFAAGVMPTYVLADYLEENVPDTPPHALELLRLPYSPDAIRGNRI